RRSRSAAAEHPAEPAAAEKPAQEPAEIGLVGGLARLRGLTRWGQVVDEQREEGGEHRQERLDREPARRRELLDRVGPHCVRELLRLDGRVAAGGHPRIDLLAETTVAELLEQAVDAAVLVDQLLDAMHTTSRGLRCSAQ